MGSYHHSMGTYNKNNIREIQMALLCCRTLGVLTVTSSLSFCWVPSVAALEALNEQALAEVTGQAQGLRYTSEFDASVDTISYIDDDGLDGGPLGELTLSPVRIYTQTNRPVQVDLEVRDVDGEKALERKRSKKRKRNEAMKKDKN